MKKLNHLIVLVMVILLGVSIANAEITKRCDEFTNICLIIGNRIDIKDTQSKIGGRVQIVGMMGTKYNSNVIEKTFIKVILHRYDWVFMETAYDKEGNSFESFGHPGRSVHNNGILEQVTFDIPVEYFKAHSKTGISLKVFGGGYVVNLPAKEIQDLLNSVN